MSKTTTTEEPQMTSQNKALFVTLCTKLHGMSQQRATRAAEALQIPADFDNDNFRYVTLRELANLDAR